MVARVVFFVGFLYIFFNFQSVIVDPGSCEPTKFQCRGGGCVPYVFICDNEPDCADHSDEDDQLCSVDNKCKPRKSV